jgi:hypothetical protein
VIDFFGKLLYGLCASKNGARRCMRSHWHWGRHMDSDYRTWPDKEAS